MVELASIHLNDPNQSEEAFAKQKEETIQALGQFEQLHIAKPNSGVGKTRTVILARSGMHWIQMVKIWGNTKQESYGFAVKLVFEAKRVSDERKATRMKKAEERWGKPKAKTERAFVPYQPRNRA